MPDELATMTGSSISQRWSVAVALVAVLSCSSSDAKSPPKLACSDVPQLAWKYSRDVPDAGAEAVTSVQVPPLAANQRYLFYLLSYSVSALQHTSSQSLPSVPPPAEPQLWITSLGRVPLNGDPPEEIALQTGWQPAAVIGADDDAVYVAQYPASDGGGGSLVRISNGTTTPKQLAQSVGPIAAFAWSADAIFFADDEGIKRLPIGGGEARKLSSILGESLVFAGGRLYAAVIESGVVVCDPDTGDTTTFDADPAARELRVCGSALCWLSGSALNGSIVRRPWTGDSRVLADGLLEPHSLAVDDHSVFVTTGAFGLVLKRVPLEGGSAVQVVTGSTGLVSNKNCLYWSTLNEIYGMSLESADVAESASDASTK